MDGIITKEFQVVYISYVTAGPKNTCVLIQSLISLITAERSFEAWGKEPHKCERTFDNGLEVSSEQPSSTDLGSI